ncbi:MAG: ABC transporter permease [Candidatus Binatus sp.]|uniref:ABC transporter permease n=1 Tax=Candidatus Binatus sp. TaxID=2811406 RepID=UPI00271D66B2|nr:ABC transporter permease [Candidatus Binatus sp.]MDO8432545.1 ABC transporter permease [Candidatus Binatus sp.]
MALKLFIMALRNLWRQPRRTILTGLTFAVAVFIFTVLIAVPASMDLIAEDASRGIRLIVTERNNNSLPVKYCAAIRKIPHVLGCSPQIQWTGIYRDLRDPITTTGITNDIYTVTGSSDYSPPPAIAKQLANDRRGALIGSVLMREHHWKIGQPITLRNPSDGKMTLTFIPMAELPTIYLSRIFFFNRQLLDDAVKNAYGENIQNVAGFMSVRVDRAENLGLVANQIDENFHNSEAETQSVTESDTLANYVSAIGDVRTIIYSLCIVVLLTMLLIAANSMAMMVRDRVGEVAVMRAIGFTQVHAASLMLCEAAMIGVSGAAIGAALALWYFGAGMTLGALTGALGYVAVRPETAIEAILIAFIVSLAAAIVPVINAARIAPALAFRKVV